MAFELLLAVSIGLFGWIAWKNPLRGLVLIAAFLPCYLLRFNVAGIPSTFLEAFILVLAFVWVVKRRGGWLRPRVAAPPTCLRAVADLPLGRGGLARIELDSSSAPLLSKEGLATAIGRGPAAAVGVVAIVIAAAIISVAVAPDMMAAFGALKAFIIEPIILGLIAFDLCRSKEDRERLVNGLFAGGIFVAATVIVQWVLNVGIPAPWDVERRATGIFPYPNAAGLYLAPLIAMAIVRAWLRPRVATPPTCLRAVADLPLGRGGLLESSSSSIRAAHPSFAKEGLATAIGRGPAAAVGEVAIVIALGLPAIILTQTESALVAIPAAVGVTGLLLPSWRKRTIIAGAIICIAILVSPLRPVVIEKLTLQDYSGEIRRIQWQETTEFLKDHPLTGAGLSGYPTAIAPYHQEPSIEIFQDPHNIILNQWVELGLLGLLLLLVAMYHGAKTWLRSIRTNDVAAIAVGAALLTMIIHGLVDVPYWKNDLAAMTWILAALLLHATSSKTK